MKIPFITTVELKGYFNTNTFEVLVKSSDAVWYVDGTVRVPLTIKHKTFGDPKFIITATGEEIYSWQIPNKRICIEHVQDISIDFDETKYYPDGMACDPANFEPGEYMVKLISKTEGKARLDRMTIYKRQEGSHPMGVCGGSFLFDLQRDWMIVSSKKLI